MTSLDTFRRFVFFVAVVFDMLILWIVFEDYKSYTLRKAIFETSWKRTAFFLGEVFYFRANAAAARLIVKYLFEKS